MTRPRVALVSLTPLATGGIETHLLQLIRGLQREIDFVLVGDVHPPLQGLIEAEGVPLERVTAAGKFDLSCLLELRRVFRRRGIHVVHTHDTRGGLLGRLAGRSLGLECIHTVHTPAFFLRERGASIRFYQLVEGALNRWATHKVVFVSPTIQALYTRAGIVRASQAVCIPNGLEPFWFEVAAPRAARPGEHPAAGLRFLYVGRLSPEKDLPTLLHAFSAVSREMPHARLAIVGDGPDRASLDGLAHELGCADRIEWAGSLNREAVREALRRADVFVLASRFESMSYTLLEAMACGLACIATRVGGNADLIQDGVQGRLVAPGDPHALAAAMLAAARSTAERERMGQAARRSASRYSLETMIEKSRDLYLAAQPAGPRNDAVK
jgi:glycosyltransferase involved in cell wall biosynthesis